MRILSKPKFFFLLVMLGAAPLCAQTTVPTDYQSLAGAEAAFAQMATEKGTRDAFLANLADNAVVFEPGPVSGRKTWEKRKPGTGLLTWRQDFLAVSKSGDMGYTTGPWEYKKSPTDEAPKAYGRFLSVWKKQKDGAWKVVLDAGVETPKPTGQPASAQISATPTPGKTKIEKVDLEAARKDIRKVERRFADASAKDTGGAIIAFASDDIRVLREGVAPAAGDAAAQLMLNSDHDKTTFKPAGRDISRSGDLAYEYGKYVTARGEGPERGYYVMIWKKNVRGTWRLSVDRRQPQPPAETK